jgi:hypothetical protein
MKKTAKLMAGVTTTIMALGLSGCSSTTSSLPPEPSEYECDDWEWDDDEGTYYCDDSRSSHFGAYYLMGSMFSNKSALHKSSNYSSHSSTYKNSRNTNSSSTNKSTTSSGSSGSYKSGIGSGSKGGFGG